MHRLYLLPSIKITNMYLVKYTVHFQIFEAGFRFAFLYKSTKLYLFSFQFCPGAYSEMNRQTIQEDTVPLKLSAN